MSVTETLRRPAPRSLALATLLLAALACVAPARHIAPYDPQIDSSATALQAEMDNFLTGVVSDPHGTYDRYESWYSDYQLKLRSLLVRARAHADNELSCKQLELMQQNVESLRTAHKSGPLSPEAASTFRDLFNQGWQAVLTLELAKPHEGA